MNNVSVRWQSQNTKRSTHCDAYYLKFIMWPKPKDQKKKEKCKYSHLSLTCSMIICLIILSPYMIFCKTSS